MVVPDLQLEGVPLMAAPVDLLKAIGKPAAPKPMFHRTRKVWTKSKPARVVLGWLFGVHGTLLTWAQLMSGDPWFLPVDVLHWFANLAQWKENIANWWEN